MGIFLVAADYPAIRHAIDVSLSKTDITDPTIELPIYLDAGEQDVLEKDPDAQSRTGEDANRVKRAAIWFVAARLCHAVARVTSLATQTRDMSYTKATFDPEDKAATLRGWAYAELDKVLEDNESPEPETPSEIFTMFTSVSGARR